MKLSKEWTPQCGCGDTERRIKRMFLMPGLFWAVQGLGGMTVHTCVPTYSATWHPFNSPTHRPTHHREAHNKRGAMRRGEKIVCVGGEDERKESGGETAQQYVDRQHNSWEINTH